MNAQINEQKKKGDIQFQYRAVVKCVSNEDWFAITAWGLPNYRELNNLC